MIKSMTGFASLTRDDERRRLRVTVKAVNHRFLDLQLRLPSSLAAIESRVRALVQQQGGARPARARRLVSAAQTTAVDVELNEPFLDALTAALERARERGYVNGAIAASDLLRFPQAITIREKADEASADLSPLMARIEEAIAAALDELETHARPRGELPARRSRRPARAARRAVRAGRPGGGRRHRRAPGPARRARAGAARRHAWPTKPPIAQEIVRFVGRSDITEEVVRFRGHLEHWQALSDGPEPCGRKLDFLLQEMNREVNTAGSKAEGPAVSELIVTLEGGAREDAGAGSECRVMLHFDAACCSSSRRRPAPARRRSSSASCR